MSAARRWRAVATTFSSTPGMASSRVKAARAPFRQRVSVIAVTVAERGVPRSSAISPRIEPSATTVTFCAPSSPDATRARPDVISRKCSATSPRRSRTVPAGAAQGIRSFARLSRSVRGAAVRTSHRARSATIVSRSLSTSPPGSTGKDHVSHLDLSTRRRHNARTAPIPAGGCLHHRYEGGAGVLPGHAVRRRTCRVGRQETDAIPPRRRDVAGLTGPRWWHKGARRINLWHARCVVIMPYRSLVRPSRCSSSRRGSHGGAGGGPPMSACPCRRS